MICQIECPIISKICEVNPIYEQRIHMIDDSRVVVTSCKRGNSRCIVYIPGYDDYFYYHHVVEEYPELDFISIDIPGFGYNKFRVFDNHITEMRQICRFISEIMFIYDVDYMQVDILGFSMGGQIALYYVWYSERYSVYKFSNLLLSNPLLNFYTESSIVWFLAVFISRITYLFSNKINIRPRSLKYKSDDLFELEDIYQKNINLKKYEITNFDVNQIGGTHDKPFSNGTLVTIMNNMSSILYSSGIMTNTICVCSKKFGNEPLKEDNVCNPADIFEILPKICKNYKIYPFECGHQPFKQPYYAKCNFIEICNQLFELN